ncbi:MAG TPA: cobalamin-independent methionine synthase II family protein [Candidatus Limnocylindria bacterium]
MPDATPLFPVTTVGSWPRPASLLRLLKAKNAGEIPPEVFDAAADAAVLDVLRLQEEAGVDVVTDGEQRRDNFYSFLADRLEGVELMTMSKLIDYAEDKAYFHRTLKSLDAPSFVIKSPTVVDRLRVRGSLAADATRFLRAHTTKPIKVPLPGPYLLARSIWVKGVSDGAYPTREALAEDIVAILRDEVSRCAEAGADFVQIDEPVLSNVVFGKPVAVRSFMCAPLAPPSSDVAGELRWAVELINAVAEDAPVRTGVHICRGNWSRDESVLLAGDYTPLRETLDALDVDQWVLEFATPRAGDMAIFLEGPDREIGLGVVNPRCDAIETPEEIAARVRQALCYFDASRIWLNPDCGFGTFAERPVAATDVAVAKVRAMVAAARVLREQRVALAV